jgi:hypothetical protein
MARQLRELPTYSVGGFSTQRQLAGALQQHEAGQFQLSADLCDVMSRDDRVSAVERTRIQGLLGLDLDFESSTAGGRRAVKDRIAKDAEASWPQMMPPAQAYQWIRWGLYLGIGIGQLLRDTTSVPGKWIPRVRVWHPRYCQWDWQRRCYTLTTEQGTIDLLEDDPEWALFLPYGYERGWMNGLVRNLAGAWCFRQWTIRDWGRWSEVHGQPIKVAIVPETTEQEAKERFQREVSNLGNESTIRTVDGGEGRRFDVQFREPVGRAFDSFDKQLAFANDAISICVLGHNLTTEVKGGSFAAARVGDDVRADIRCSDAMVATDAYRSGILKRWAKWNYGDAALAPYPRYNTEPAKDLKAAADTLISVAAGLTGLRNAGANPDVEEILEEFAVPSLGPLDEEELAQMRRATAPPALAPEGAPEQPTDEKAGEPTAEGRGKPPPPAPAQA